MPEIQENKIQGCLEEWDIRYWFVHTELEQALDTFRVVEGILQARKEAKVVHKPERATARHCSYCGQIGHTKPNCEAYISATSLGTGERSK